MLIFLEICSLLLNFFAFVAGLAILWVLYFFHLHDYAVIFLGSVALFAITLGVAHLLAFLIVEGSRSDVSHAAHTRSTPLWRFGN